MKKIKISDFKLQITSLLALLIISGCGASTTNQSLDKAYFNLDNCSTSSTGPCDSAIAQADTVIAIDSNNSEARIIKSSALATRGGFNILNQLSQLTQASGTSFQTKFADMHTSVINTISNITDLRSAIDALPTSSAPTDTTNQRYNDYYFQLGILQAFEAFTQPTYLAQPTTDATVDVTQITSKTDVQNDFLQAEPNLYQSGITGSTIKGWDIVKALRQNYCVLKNVSAGTGFQIEALRDLVKCQLCVSGVHCDRAAADMILGRDLELVATCNTFDWTACNNAPQPTE